MLFTSVNLSGLFVRILTERAQRKAFLQARNCIEERLRMEDENEKQVHAIKALWCRGMPTYRKYTTVHTFAIPGKTGECTWQLDCNNTFSFHDADVDCIYII